MNPSPSARYDEDGPNASRIPMARRAFTFIEVLVVVGVCCLLLALAVPAILHARGAAAHVESKSRLRQLSVAISQYESTHGALPPGGSRPARENAVGDAPPGR